MAKTLSIIAGARTPMAEYVGTAGAGKLKDLSAVKLGAHAIAAALQRSGVKPEAVDQVVMGNVLQSSADAIYGARHAALYAGIPIGKPALTVNRLCGSGIQSIISAAQLLLLGEAETVVAGGMENMSQAPHVIRGAREGFALGQGKLEDSLMSALLDPYCSLYMAQTAEKLAREYKIGRAEQDEFALLSTQRAKAAIDAGRLAEEIAPVAVKQRGQAVDVSRDDHLRAENSIAALTKLRPAFGEDGTVTAGNASGIVDGAAAMVLTSASVANPLARVIAWEVVGVDPSIMGIGPAPAIRGLIAKAGLKLTDIDLFEVNEAFAAQYLAVEKELGLARDRVNVNGGAIALGHPLGATGARLVLTLALELKRRRARRGIASACIGGGQGIAILIESA
ncbi:MAG: acetyl-CoA C-acetyltransferase [Planctomycetota bacterium]